MHTIGILIAVAGVALAVLPGSRAAAFVDLPALIFVLLVGGGITVAAHGFRAVTQAVGAIFGRRGVPTHVPIREIGATGRRAFMAAGWVGVIIGVVQMLSVLDDPSRIGPGMAVALLSAFYGYLAASLVFLPMECSTRAE